MGNTPNLNLNRPEYGSGRWDKDLNENFDILDTAIAKALDGQGGHYIGEEAPLNPRYGQIWIDTKNGSIDNNVITGRYKVYDGENWEELNFVIDEFGNVKSEISELEDGFSNLIGRVDDLGLRLTETSSQITITNENLNKKLNKDGDTATGVIKAYANTDYATPQIRNIIISNKDAVLGEMSNGDIWIKYE